MGDSFPVKLGHPGLSGAELERWVVANIKTIGEQVGLGLSDVVMESRSGDRRWDIVANAGGIGKTIFEIKSNPNRLPGEMIEFGRHDDARVFVWVTSDYQPGDLARVKRQGSRLRDLLEVIGIEIRGRIDGEFLVPITRVCPPPAQTSRRMKVMQLGFDDVEHDPIPRH